MRLAALILVTAASMGCYHAAVDTGLTPSGHEYTERWAHGFLYGLFSPSTVSAVGQCESGVARIHTRLSAVNQVAMWLTGGIYSPMTITVECAAASDMEVGSRSVQLEGREPETIEAGLAEAASQALHGKAPVWVLLPDASTRN